jgi:peptide chain release factor 2
LEETTSDPKFWEDPVNSQKLLQQIKQLQNQVSAFDRLITKYDDAVTMAELGIEAQDESVVPESEILTKQFVAAYERFRIETLLSGEYDANNAIITLHSGAGGTESCDWVAMLYRMYAQWAQKRGFKFEELDLLEGEEAGVKSVTFQISGENAFGYMKCEKGVHRLVRISPFDSSGRRHTSFASCDVMPELDDDNLIEINPDDLKVDTYRSSGAGGQHVNKTESAIRITHIPTGIIVQCQNERSQIKNRDRAMKMLKAKLYVLKQEEQMAKLNGIRGEVKDIAWGSQIRSYVFHPYSMVKDHRTNEEVGNVQGVMDGALDNFMNAYLVWAARKDA